MSTCVPGNENPVTPTTCTGSMRYFEGAFRPLDYGQMVTPISTSGLLIVGHLWPNKL